MREAPNKDKRERRSWFRILLQLRGSVIPSILPRVLLCGIFGFLISLLNAFGIDVSLPTLSSVVPSIVLGLLLVFRTNTAYERFWEGRKAWGTLVNTVRNLARIIWVTVEEKDPKDRHEKIAALRLLVAFAVATKLHLRSEPIVTELEALMPPDCYEKLKTMNNPPLEVAFWIGNYFQQQYNRDRIDGYQLINMFQLLDKMVEVLGSCERILRTPIPLAYSIHLKQLLLLYCLTLPFQVVMELGWSTAPIVALISFAVFGIEEIGIEIENPFGRDPNDLPLDQICQTMQININDLITLAPSVRHWYDRSESTEFV
jgi:putative membrane protein